MSLWVSAQENLESTTIDLNEIQQQRNDTIQIEQNNSACCLSVIIIKDITERKKEKMKCYEEDFQSFIVQKLRDKI